MPLAESSTIKLTWTLYLLSGITIPIYGVEVLGLFVLYYIMSILLDITSGFIAARTRRKILSKTFIEGLMLKGFILCFILLLVGMSIGVTTLLGNYSMEMFGYNIHVASCIGLIPHIFIIFFAFGENISFVENLAIIYRGTKQGLVFNVLSFLSNKLYNSSLEYLQENIEKKIDNKFDKDLKK